MTVLLRLSFVRGAFLQLLPWAAVWFLLAFVLACLAVSALFDISFQQAVSWWGVAFTATIVLSWIAALGLALLYRYLLLPSLTDFF